MGENKKKTPNPLRGCSLSVRLSLLWRHLFEIHPRYYSRALSMIVVSSIRYPVMKKEHKRIAEKIRQTEVVPDPVFILGHWRSGTTHLHNLMIQDNRFNFPTLFQTVFPQCFFAYERLKPLLAERLPDSRPMDNMKVSFDLPQEEEFAIANLSRCSVYHGLTFPRSSCFYFERYGLLEGASDREITLWQETYEYFLKKVTLTQPEKPLVLKNPVNTGRVGRLLEMWPNAKFIHIYRNPYEVFLSTFKMLRSMGDIMQLQPISDKELEETVLSNYEKMMSRYFTNRNRIPQGQLYEMSYENLIENPLQELKQVYRALRLPDIEWAMPKFEEYARQQKNYQRNQFQLKAEWREKVRQRWGFAVKEWGYPAPSIS